LNGLERSGSLMWKNRRTVRTRRWGGLQWMEGMWTPLGTVPDFPQDKESAARVVIRGKGVVFLADKTRE